MRLPFQSTCTCALAARRAHSYVACFCGNLSVFLRSCSRTFVGHIAFRLPFQWICITAHAACRARCPTCAARPPQAILPCAYLFDGHALAHAQHAALISALVLSFPLLPLFFMLIVSFAVVVVVVVMVISLRSFTAYVLHIKNKKSKNKS